MRAVVAVIGKDTVGILAKVSGICAEHKANVMDVTQTMALGPVTLHIKYF